MASYWWKELYLLDRAQVRAIMAPDSDGVITIIEPQPFVLRAVYVGPDNLEREIPRARGRLIEPNCPLLVLIPCPDGPPHRCGLYFTCEGTRTNISWRDEKNTHFAASLRSCLVLTGSGPSGLVDKRQGRLGFIVSGSAGEDSLWRVTRLETDAFDRSVFTLAPIRMAPNLPIPDFSAIKHSLLAAELTQQFQDLCRSVTQHGYRDVVTKARNIVEGLVGSRLQVQQQPSAERLYNYLAEVEKLLNNKKTRDTCGWTDLQYHLCHKIRLLHAQTHVGHVLQSGALRPELALTVIEDLLYLLGEWGFVQQM